MKRSKDIHTKRNPKFFKIFVDFLPCFLLMLGSLSSLPQKTGILPFSLDHALILKEKIMTMASSEPFNSIYMQDSINVQANV
jgi:hypothetical protein